jgi:hypothetical protein
MYLGIDFLVDLERRPFVVDVNIGLPGGATEIDRIHRVRHGRRSDILSRIEATSRAVYGRSFSAYLASLPFLESLKRFKLWVDGYGGRPEALPPALRLEDKWVQYQVLRDIAPLPPTEPFRLDNDGAAAAFLSRFRPAVLKRRLGRGGRGFKIVRSLSDLAGQNEQDDPRLFQDFVMSRIDGYALSVRVLAFGGRCLGMHASLAAGDISSDGILAEIITGPRFALSGLVCETVHFDEKTWEAELWFPCESPAYLHTNLYEDDVAREALMVPGKFSRLLSDIAVRVERTYEALEFSTLPRACFEE